MWAQQQYFLSTEVYYTADDLITVTFSSQLKK